MPERCLGRIIRRNKEAIAHFTNGSRFYLESRCSYTVTQGEICSRCQGWKENGMNKKDIYGNHFGLVTEELPSDCHIFESDWYTSKVKEYGYPSEFEMARAKQSQQEAREGVVGVKEVKEVKEVKTEEKQKPKRQYKKKEQTPLVATTAVATEPIVEKPKGTVGKRRPKNALPAEAPAPVPVVTVSEEKPKEEKLKEEKPKEEKPKAKRQYKKKEPITTVTPVVSSKVEVQAVEGKPFESELEIVKILVRPFTHNDVSYFRDSTKNKLYSVGKDKRPSTYVGRWDPDSETINTDFPDSDAE